MSEFPQLYFDTDTGVVRIAGTKDAVAEILPTQDWPGGEPPYLEDPIGFLFAAAPDMLAALKKVQPFVEYFAASPSHPGACGPESGCDCECAAVASHARLLAVIDAALDKATSINQCPGARSSRRSDFPT